MPDKKPSKPETKVPKERLNEGANPDKAKNFERVDSASTSIIKKGHDGGKLPSKETKKTD